MPGLVNCFHGDGYTCIAINHIISIWESFITIEWLTATDQSFYRGLFLRCELCGAIGF